VHALLRYLEAVGFDGAPRLLGIDAQVAEQARKVWRLCDAYGWPSRWMDQKTAALIELATPRGS
jgi:hypothetical protein